MPDHARSIRLYRKLLRLYPAAFREHYEGPLDQAFRDELARTRGPVEFALLWLRLVADLLISIPTQAAQEAVQDSRHTVRLWAKHPWHTIFAVAALAIGIGGTTGAFSVINSLLLSSLPFHDPTRLASFHPSEFIPPHGSAKEFHDWREQSEYLADAALVEEGDVNVGGVGAAIRIHAARTSWNLFSTLGVPIRVGRSFLAGEDAPGRNEIAVISNGLWQQLFAGDARALSASIFVNGKPLTIIGVAPPGFDYPGGTGLWQPAEYSPGNNGWATVARLKPGITWTRAHAAFDADVSRLQTGRNGQDSAAPRPRMRSLQNALVGPASGASVVLLAGVVLLLLIACINVANLLMARVAERNSELSIRASLGASRGRLTQQLLTECLMLSAVAAVAGLLVAVGITSIATRVQPPPLSAMSYTVLDGPVLAFTMIVSILVSLAFGMLPSLSLGRIHASSAKGSIGIRGSRVAGHLLTAAQVTLTILLLTASVSVGRAFVQLMMMDRGYDAKGIVTVNVSLEGTIHETSKRQLAYFEEVLARLRRLPGVRSASATEFLPLYATGFIGGPFGVDGRRANRNSTMVPVLSGYFSTMGGRILQGREFTEAEVRAGANSRVAVVNERFAAAFGGPVEVLGRQLTAGRGPAWRIVGVVKGMEFETDPSLANSNQVFVPAESPGGFFSTLVARVDGRAEDHVAGIRETIRSVDPAVPVFGAKTMEQRLADFYVRPRFYRASVWIFAAIAALLALIGIYGTVSCAVARRTREMGLRMVLGATPAKVRGMLLSRGLVVVMAGAVFGILGARLTTRFLESLIAGAQPVELPTSVGLAVALTAVASVSIWAATRRIPRLDMMEILRGD